MPARLRRLHSTQGVGHIPNNPTGLIGVPASTSIAYSWNTGAVDGTHDAALTFQLQTSPDGTTWSNAGSPVSSLSQTVTGLPSSTLEYARVQAINSTGTSVGFSNVDSTTTSAAGASFGPGLILGDSTTARSPTVTSFLTNPTQAEITDLAIPGEKTIGQIGRFDALSSGVKAALKWIIVMTGQNDFNDFPDGPTVVANYQAAITHLRAVCPTAKIIISRTNPNFAYSDLFLFQGPTVPAKLKAQWVALNDAIAGLGPTPITGADFRCVAHTVQLMDPAYANNLNPIYQENPNDVHQNPAGSAIIGAQWQNALNTVFYPAVVLGSKHAYCAGKLAYNADNYPFLDRMKGGAGFNQFGSCTKNAAGWLTVMPPGASASSLVCSNAAWFPPGDYAITSTCAGTITLGGFGMTNVVNGVHRATFTVPEYGTDDAWRTNFTLQPSITNNTGSNIACMDFKIFLVANESLINSGGDNSVFEPAYLALLAGAKVIRFEEWMGMNAHGYSPSGMWKFADFGVQTLDKPSYVNIEGMGGACVPAMMLLCKLLGARPWISIGNAGNQQQCRYTHTDNKFHPQAWYDYGQPGFNRFANGVKITFGSPTNPTNATGADLTTSLFVVNSAQGYDGSFQLSATSGGSPIQISTVDMGFNTDFGFTTFAQVTGLDEYNDMFLPLAQLMFSIDPTCQPMVEYANECWNFIYDQWFYLHYVIGRVVLNTNLQSAAYMYMAMKLFKAFDDTFPHAQVGRMIAWETQPIDFDYQILSAGLDFPDTTGIYDNTKTFRQSLLLEPTRNYFCVAPYIEPQKSDGSWHNAQSIFAQLGHVPTNLEWDAYFDDSIAKWVHGVYFDWPAIKASLDVWLPGGKFCWYEAGQQCAFNQSDAPEHLLVGQSLSYYLESSSAAAMYQRWWTALAAPYDLDFAAWYDSEGSRVVIGSAFQHWGITNRWQDNPASKWLRTK